MELYHKLCPMVLESTLDINLSFLVRDSDFKEWELLYKHDGIIVV